MSMSLRNEPREPSNVKLKAHTTGKVGMSLPSKGTQAINSVNKDVLIFLSGLSFDTYLTPVVQGTALTPGTAKFSFNDFPGYANKLVLELHNYPE